MKSVSLRLARRKTMRLQAAAIAYFGGYTTKRQQRGRFEAKKCINKAHELCMRKMKGTEGANYALRLVA